MAEWVTKLISVIKIPIKILIPAIWLFSFIVIISSDGFLSQLGVLEWRNNNKFVFGLLLLISSCLIAIYVLYYLIRFLAWLFQNKFFKLRYAAKIIKLSQKEKEILLYLFNSDGYTNSIDYADPVIKRLIARDYIYIGNNVPVTGYGNQMIVNGTLQPAVWKTMEWLKNKEKRRVD
jgi:hypothetical protein